MYLGVNSLKNNTNNNAAQIKKSDYITNKLLLVFTLAFAMILFLMNMSRMMKLNTTFVLANSITKGVFWAAVVVIVGGIVMAVLEHNRGRDTKYVLFTGKNIARAGGFIAVCTGALSLVFSPTMLMLLYIMIPALVVLYIIFYSYPREFFAIALASFIAGVAIWLVGSDLINENDLSVLIIAAALVVILAAVTVWAQAKGGKILLFGREIEVFKSDARYTIVYLTYVLALLLLGAAFLVSDLILYFVLGIVAYIVLIGVYYTVKLI